MLVVRPDTIEDCVVTDLAGLLRPGDVLVFNDARVIPAQLEGRRGEAKVGATLHKREGTREGRAFIRTIGSESWRARVCQYGKSAVGGYSLHKNTTKTLK